MVHCSVMPRANHVVGYEGHGCSDMNHIAATKPYCGTRNFVLDATVSCSDTNCGAIVPNQHPGRGGGRTNLTFA